MPTTSKNTYGTGSFCKQPAGNIRYRLRYTSQNGVTKHLSVYGKDKKDCIKLMEIKKQEFEAESRMADPNKGLFGTNIENWLNACNQKTKKKTLEDTSFDRLMSLFRAQIKGSFGPVLPYLET